jgi:hypothetical protein
MDIRLIGCPEEGCGLPAEVVHEEMWPSTDGGLMMAKVVGTCGHWFLMPAWKLDLGMVFAVDDHTGLPVPLN